MLRSFLKKNRVILIVILVVTSSIVALTATDLFRSISDNLRVYNKVVKYLLSDYVDEIDSEKIVRASIEGMLKDLDPYTVFFVEEDQSQVEMLTKGKYGGVGIRIGVRGDTLTVIAPMENSPGYRAGIQPGDLILKIDGKSTLEMNSDEAAKNIRGKPGTTVVLQLLRIGESEAFDVPLVREEIVVNDLPYFGIDDGIGYIRINRFSRHTARQFSKAIIEMQGKGIDGLVVDLRGNPGGLMNDAIYMVDALVEKGVPIVETRGRAARTDTKHESRTDPILNMDTPLAVLVNGGSASASEIVAGAIQDLDRGVIIGQMTFGKGLVQSLVPVGKNQLLKITTAKYYIPSGRLIQKEDYEHGGVLTDGQGMKDSLFVTMNGRSVRGGGGITPDVKVESNYLPPFTRRLWSRSMFFRFASRSKDKYDLSLPINISDRILNDFEKFVTKETIEYNFPGESDLKTFEEKVSEIEGFEGEIDISALKSFFKKKHDSAFEDEKKSISTMLQLEFASLVGGENERVHTSLIDDPIYKKAVSTIKDKLAYNGILSPGDKSAEKRK